MINHGPKSWSLLSSNCPRDEWGDGACCDPGKVVNLALVGDLIVVRKGRTVLLSSPGLTGE